MSKLSNKGSRKIPLMSVRLVVVVEESQQPQPPDDMLVK